MNANFPNRESSSVSSGMCHAPVRFGNPGAACTTGLGTQNHPSFRNCWPRIPNPATSKVLVWADGVADRGPCAKHVVVAEDVSVVIDVVVVNLGTNKNVSPDVVADAAADIRQEVTTANEIVAGKTVRAVGQIKTSTLPADASHEVQADLLAHLGLVHDVEIRKDGTIGLSAGSAVRSLAPSPGSLKVEADAPVEDYVGTETWVEASLFWTEASGCVARSRRQESVAAEHGVPLLRRGKLGEEQEGEHRCEKR